MEWFCCGGLSILDHRRSTKRASNKEATGNTMDVSSHSFEEEISGAFSSLVCRKCKYLCPHLCYGWCILVFVLRVEIKNVITDCVVGGARNIWL